MAHNPKHQLSAEEQEINQYLKNCRDIAALQQANENIAKKIQKAHKNSDLDFAIYKSIGQRFGLDIAETEQFDLIFENQGEKIAFLDNLHPQFKSTGFNTRQIAQQAKTDNKLRDLMEKHKVTVRKNKVLALLPR